MLVEVEDGFYVNSEKITSALIKRTQKNKFYYLIYGGRFLNKFKDEEEYFADVEVLFASELWDNASLCKLAFNNMINHINNQLNME